MSYPFNNINIHALDSNHIADMLQQVPQQFHAELLADYERKYTESRRDANLGLIAVQKYAKDKTFLSHDDDSLRVKAERLAREAAQIIHRSGIDAGALYVELQGCDLPNADSNDSLKARLVDANWWVRSLIKKHDREFEETAVKFGLVRKHKQPYVSTATLTKILARQQRSLEIMKRMEAVSDDGETLDMLDVLTGSIANPAVRRAELMNRLQGFEQYALDHHHVAEFYTLTVPSKYHPSSSKYNEWTPRQVQQSYLSPLWSRIRAKLKYDGLNVYGFRIAEPHADSCPHWHILLFMPESHKAKVKAIFKDYALREDGDEKGAAKNRFDVESIDPSKGSAIGYIAKYISKNVDGFNMEGETDDETGKPVNESAKRVRAWASVWGIRQFQQVGGSSITVWRELRRLDGEQVNETIEAARVAADSGDWKAYLEAQGGTETLFKDQPIKTARDKRIDESTGEIRLNQYGELVEYVKGVKTTGILIETRLKHWTIQGKAESDNADDQVSSSRPAPESVERGIKRLLQPMATHTALAFDLPWSSVNNCRKPDFEKMMGFEKTYLKKELDKEYTKRLESGYWEALENKLSDKNYTRPSREAFINDVIAGKY